MEFNIGDVVRLKCGGPLLVVSRLNYDDGMGAPPTSVDVIYSDEKHIQSEQGIPVECLVKG